MTDQTDLEKRTLTIERTFNAPRSLVWQAWTEPGHIARWWGPKGMPVTIRKHDFQVGGTWEYAMPMPNGQEFISHGVYARIEAPELLETTANFIPMTEGVTLLIELEEAGDQTHMKFRVIHPTEAYAKQQDDMGFQNGWGSVFTGLAAYLEALQA